MIKQPHYIGLEEARQLLAQMGVALTAPTLTRMRQTGLPVWAFMATRLPSPQPEMMRRWPWMTATAGLDE